MHSTRTLAAPVSHQTTTTKRGRSTTTLFSHEVAMNFADVMTQYLDGLCEELDAKIDEGKIKDFKEGKALLLAFPKQTHQDELARLKKTEPGFDTMLHETHRIFVDISQGLGANEPPKGRGFLKHFLLHCAASEFPGRYAEMTPAERKAFAETKIRQTFRQQRAQKKKAPPDDNIAPNDSVSFAAGAAEPSVLSMAKTGKVIARSMSEMTRSKPQASSPHRSNASQNERWAHQ